jgi:hypothetical protein
VNKIWYEGDEGDAIYEMQEMTAIQEMYLVENVFCNEVKIHEVIMNVYEVITSSWKLCNE